MDPESRSQSNQERRSSDATKSRYAGLSLLLLAAHSACGAGSGECVDLPASCSPAISTDYNTIYKSVLGQRCGSSVGTMSCHAEGNSPSGLVLSDPDTAYNHLLGLGAPSARIIPGDAECSPLMERIATGDAAQRMPLGQAPLSDGVRCAIQTWIREGAIR